MFSAIASDSGMEIKIYFQRFCPNGVGVLFYYLETGSYHSVGVSLQVRICMAQRDGVQLHVGLNLTG